SPGGSAPPGTAPYDFGAATVTSVDDCVDVTDTLGGSLGKVCSTDPSPKTFTYSKMFTDNPGTCTTHDNTATFTTNTTKTSGSDNKSVKDCVGADLTVSKTATPTFIRTYAWGIGKTANATLIEQLGGGTASVGYTVIVNETGFADSGWALSGTITAPTPNNWEAITANVTEIAACSVTNGVGVSIPASSSVNLSYSCSFSSGASGTNTATATW